MNGTTKTTHVRLNRVSEDLNDHLSSIFKSKCKFYQGTARDDPRELPYHKQKKKAIGSDEC